MDQGGLSFLTGYIGRLLAENQELRSRQNPPPQGGGAQQQGPGTQGQQQQQQPQTGPAGGSGGDPQLNALATSLGITLPGVTGGAGGGGGGAGGVAGVTPFAQQGFGIQSAGNAGAAAAAAPSSIQMELDRARNLLLQQELSRLQQQQQQQQNNAEQQMSDLSNGDNGNTGHQFSGMMMNKFGAAAGMQFAGTGLDGMNMMMNMNRGGGGVFGNQGSTKKVVDLHQKNKHKIPAAKKKTNTSGGGSSNNKSRGYAAIAASAPRRHQKSSSMTDEDEHNPIDDVLSYPCRCRGLPENHNPRVSFLIVHCALREEISSLRCHQHQLSNTIGSSYFSLFLVARFKQTIKLDGVHFDSGRGQTWVTPTVFPSHMSFPWGPVPILFVL